MTEAKPEGLGTKMEPDGAEGVEDQGAASDLEIRDIGRATSDQGRA